MRKRLMGFALLSVLALHPAIVQTPFAPLISRAEASTASNRENAPHLEPMTEKILDESIRSYIKRLKSAKNPRDARKTIRGIKKSVEQGLLSLDAANPEKDRDIAIRLQTLKIFFELIEPETLNPRTCKNTETEIVLYDRPTEEPLTKHLSPEASFALEAVRALCGSA